VQMHYHRSEHWVVVAGQARVHYDDKSRNLSVNESTYHGKEVVHALENVGDMPLELIEVQVGSYLGEDDIVRFDDVYGRAAKNNFSYKE
jgi:mannose-6-phosphate isomerase-like protein (cupin superfamily)